MGEASSICTQGQVPLLITCPKGWLAEEPPSPCRMPQPGGPGPWCPSGSRLELSWEIILFGPLPEAEMTTKTQGNSGPLATTALGTNCHLLPFWEGWLGGGARSCPIIMMLVSRVQSGDRAEPAGAWTRPGLLIDVTISPRFFPFLSPYLPPGVNGLEVVRTM